MITWAQKCEMRSRRGLSTAVRLSVRLSARLSVTYQTSPSPMNWSGWNFWGTIGWIPPFSKCEVCVRSWMLNYSGWRVDCGTWSKCQYLFNYLTNVPHFTNMLSVICSDEWWMMTSWKLEPGRPIPLEEFTQLPLVRRFRMRGFNLFLTNSAQCTET